MKKLVVKVPMLLMLLVLPVCSAHAATTDPLSTSGAGYTFSINVAPGDHLVIYSDNDNVTYNVNLENELLKYNGILYDVPVKKQAIHEANIRTGPGMSYDVVDRLIVGDTITVYGEFRGVDEESNWIWYVLGDGTYVSAHLLSDASEVTARPARAHFEMHILDAPVWKKTVQLANVRSGPGTQYPTLYSLTEGSTVQVIGTVDSSSNESTWYILNDGTYVSSRLF